MPKKRRNLTRDDAILNSKEHEALVAEGEISSLGNPYFSYDRCPRYNRLHKIAIEKEHRRLDAVLEPPGGEKGAKLSAASWKKKAAQEIARWERERKLADNNPQSLWQMVCTAEEIRTFTPAQCKAEGYKHAMLIINDKQTMTVGQSMPLQGERSAHHTVFLVEYEDASHASAEGDGAEGVTSVRTVNDTCAIIIYELGKVALKLLLAFKLMDSTLTSHLSLYSEATGRLEDMRRALVQLERHTEAYKVVLDVIKERVAQIIRAALDAQRAGALSLEQFLDDTLPSLACRLCQGSLPFRQCGWLCAGSLGIHHAWLSG